MTRPLSRNGFKIENYHFSRSALIDRETPPLSITSVRAYNFTAPDAEKSIHNGTDRRKLSVEGLTSPCAAR